MALALHAIRTLAPYLKSAKVLSLAYPDIVPDADELERVLGIRATKFAPTGHAHGVKRDLVETEHLFELLGSELTCIDVVAHRGCEKVIDLNEPQALGKYDLVIDPGTIEHCFNIGMAVMNAASAVKPGGRIYHSPPMFMMNHGFYNVCPTMLWDFYTQNGWNIELLEARHHFVDQAVDINAAKLATNRRAKAGPETSVICLAERKTSVPLRWPVQSKYLAMYESMRKVA